jgi:16S rRNA (guanine(966)-N(2))-methyltransferase RsmD
MRVTGGVLRSRRVPVPPGPRVRPTQDKVREALFSALAARIPGCRFLDLFAGSGVVGLEAWSRGAACVCWVERDPRVVRTLRQTVAALCGGEESGRAVSRPRVVRADALEYLAARGAEAPFDVVFADPPYDREGRAQWLDRLCRALATGGWIAAGGILIYEQARRETAVWPDTWRLLHDRTYGETRLLGLAPGLQRPEGRNPCGTPRSIPGRSIR